MRGDGRKVKAQLALQGRTTTWLARQVDVDRSSMEHILAGDRDSKDELFWPRIAGLLGVGISALMMDEDDLSSRAS